MLVLNHSAITNLRIVSLNLLYILFLTSSDPYKERSKLKHSSDNKQVSAFKVFTFY